jgi:dipeptidyl aminopeptidase/acylaminoacyl peptidase
MNRWVIGAGVLLLSVGAARAQRALPAAERGRVNSVINSVERGVSIGQAEVSPDGRLLAWVEGGRGGQQIRVAPMDHVEQSRRVTVAGAANCEENEITWAPDSHALAFLSDCASQGKQDDLYVAAVDGVQQHAARRVTTLRGFVDAPSYSPDGKKIAFLYVEGATRPSGALAAEKPPSGVIGEDDVEVQRVAMADAAAQQPEPPVLYTPAKLHVFEFDWAPDSQGLAYVAADPPGENNWWVAKLYTQRSTAEPKVILTPAEVEGPLHGMQIAAPRWSPDGKTIALIGGLMSDQGVTGGDVWLVPSDGGTARNATPELKATAVWVDWDGNRRLVADEIAGGDCRLVRMELGGDGAVGKTTTLFSVPGMVGNGQEDERFSSSSDRSVFVMVGSTFERAPEVYAFRPGQLKEAHEFRDLTQLTHLNETVSAVQGKTVSINWKSEGFDVQGWLMLPKDYDPARKYPMIVEVHGGPAAAELSRWSPGGLLSPAVFSALGYFVLLPNPRGSFGQGEAFTQANRKDFGYGDLRDILAGVDTVLAKYPVDANRVGLTGWSYGGFMTMFAVTQTKRFKAAVAGAGISDWLSYYGENQIDQWMIPYFGASVYDDPQVYAKSSAINFIKQVKTPVLMVVGDRDGECPAPQSYEFWHALRDRHVPSQLVVYPNEGHGFRDPEHSRDVLERAAAWFAEHMPANPTE